MKRFLTLSFLLCSLALSGQNLIPDPSAEDFVECPNSLGFPELWLNNWESYRGSPDYFNNCNSNLGSNNSFGFQEPRSGDGYLGTILHHTSLFNAREYLGITLTESMEIGQTYKVSFYASLAYRVSGGARTSCNNLGFLLMTENYLDEEEQGLIVNFSSFSVDTIIADTMNWVFIEETIIADSSYNFIAFGNFFDDILTDFTFPFEPDNAGFSYYYLDDFCVTTDLNGCQNYLTIIDQNQGIQLSIWPNPTVSELNYSSGLSFSRIRIFNLQGKLVHSEEFVAEKEGKVNLNLATGIYLIEFATNKKSVRKRFVVQ